MQEGRPIALKNLIQKGDKDNLNLAEKYSLYKVNWPERELHAQSISSKTSSLKPGGFGTYFVAFPNATPEFQTR